MAKLSTEPYKGVRDFYPKEQFVQQYIAEVERRACEKYGYEEYNASVLEPAELYRSKTSEEIVNEQTYTFTDRGDRAVTLRPEMTPTVARLVAHKRRELGLPLRLYSIQNFFRYERPQHGRLREFWQLNADIFGVPGVEAEVEIIALAHSILIGFGASEHDFEIRINDRSVLQTIAHTAGLDEQLFAHALHLLDRRAKMDNFEDVFARELGATTARAFLDGLAQTASNTHIERLRELLALLNVRNVVVDTSIVRGFDYYTGMVFEVFDTSEANPRSLAGGGRYDNLLSLFGEETVPVVGFALGDVTARDFLDTHNLIPPYRPATELMLGVVDTDAVAHAMKLAADLRSEDITVAINYSGKRPGDQIKQAEKLGIPFFILIGDKERDSGTYVLKNIQTGDEITLPPSRIVEHMASALG